MRGTVCYRFETVSKQKVLGSGAPPPPARDTGGRGPFTREILESYNYDIQLSHYI
jgi:hypothetical protein